MGNSLVGTSNAHPQIIHINHLHNQQNFENQNNIDYTDNISMVTAEFDSPKPNNQYSIITEEIQTSQSKIKEFSISLKYSDQKLFHFKKYIYFQIIIYVRRNLRRKCIIVSKSSKSFDETEIQNEN